MGLPTKVENFISDLIDRLFSSKGFQPVDLCRMAVRCMDQGSRQGINRTYAPNVFILTLHGNDYRKHAPVLHFIKADILACLKQHAVEHNYLLAGDLLLTLEEDEHTPEGTPRIIGRMSDGDEPDSVVSYRQQTPGDSPEQGSRDNAGTAPDYDPADPLSIIEEGVTVLREGHPEQAVEVLAAVENSARDTPQYQALMGVCRQLSGEPEQAEEHLYRLQQLVPDMNIPALPIPEVTDNGDNEQWQARKNLQKNRATFRLAVNIDGVCLIVGENTLRLENPYLDPAVTVRGKVEKTADIRPGDVVTLGTIRLHITKS